jgi:serine/threonine protein kinase
MRFHRARYSSPNFTATKEVYFTTNQVTGSFDIDLKCDSMVRCDLRPAVRSIPEYHHLSSRRIASASTFGGNSRGGGRDKEPSFSFPMPLMQDGEFGGFMLPRQPQQRFRFGDGSSSRSDDSDASSESSDNDDDDDDDCSGDGEGEINLELYIQMEYCQNTLREVISKSSPSSSSSGSSGGGNEHSNKLQIMRQITEALAYLHSSGASTNHKPYFFYFVFTLFYQASSIETSSPTTFS